MITLCDEEYKVNWKDVVYDYNDKYMSPGSKEEVQNIIKSLSKKEYFYLCDEEPLKSCCNKQLCLKRQYGIGEEEVELEVMVDQLQKIETKPIRAFEECERRVERLRGDIGKLERDFAVMQRELSIIQL